MHREKSITNTPIRHQETIVRHQSSLPSLSYSILVVRASNGKPIYRLTSFDGCSKHNIVFSVSEW